MAIKRTRRASTKRSTTTRRKTTTRRAPRRSAADDTMDTITKAIGGKRGSSRSGGARSVNTITEKEMMDRLMKEISKPAFKREFLKMGVAGSKKRLQRAQNDDRLKSSDPQKRLEAREEVRRAKVSLRIDTARLKGDHRTADRVQAQDDLLIYTRQMVQAQKNLQQARKDGNAKNIKRYEKTYNAHRGYAQEARAKIRQYGGRA